MCPTLSATAEGQHMNRPSTESIELLLDIIDQAYNKKAWHGTNLRGSLRGLSGKEVSWRPSAGRHNIWEIAVHAAYWKYIVRRRMTGEQRGSFPLKGSNWFERPESAGRKWKDDIALLEQVHHSMRAAIAALPPSKLHFIPPTSKVSNAVLIYGMASHDLYHAGQIQLLKRLQSTRT